MVEKMWDGGKLDEKTWRQMDSELSVSSIASLEEEEEEEIGISLPPRISSTERGAVILSIPRVIESSSSQQKIPSTSHVRVRWWGENKPGSLFRPLKKNSDENETQSNEESFATSLSGRIKYPICASRRRFSQYLNDMKILVLDVIDRETRKKYGKCEVSVKVQGTTDEAFEKITLKEAECEIKSTLKGRENEVIGFLVVTLEIWWEDSSPQQNLLGIIRSPTQVDEIDETDLYLTSPVANPALLRRRSSPIYQSVPPGNSFGRSAFYLSQIQQDPDESVASVNSVPSFQPHRYFSPLIPPISNIASDERAPLDRRSNDKSQSIKISAAATRLGALLEKGKALRRSMEQAVTQVETNQHQVPLITNTLSGYFLSENDPANKEIKTSMLLATCHALTSTDGSSTGEFLDWKDLLAHMRKKTGELEEDDVVPIAQPKPVLNFSSGSVEFQANFLLQLRRILRGGSAQIQLFHTNPTPSSQKMILATTVTSTCKGKNLEIAYNFTSEIASDQVNDPKFMEFRIVFEPKNQQKGSYQSIDSKNNSITLKGSIAMEKIVESMKESQEFQAEIILHEERKNRFSSARINRTMPKEVAAKMNVIFTGTGFQKQSSSEEIKSTNHNGKNDLADDVHKESIDLQQLEYQSPRQSFDSVRSSLSVSSPASSPPKVSRARTMKRPPKRRNVMGRAAEGQAILLMIPKALNVHVRSNFSSGFQFKKKRNLSIWIEYAAPFTPSADKRFKSKVGRIREISSKNASPIAHELVNIQFDHAQILPIDENLDFEIIEDGILILELWASFNKAEDEKLLSKKLLGIIKIPLSVIAKRLRETSRSTSRPPCSCIDSISTISDPFFGNSNGLLEIKLMLGTEVKISEYLHVVGPIAKLQAIVRGALSRRRHKIKRKHLFPQKKPKIKQDHTTITQLVDNADKTTKLDQSNGSLEVTAVNTPKEIIEGGEVHDQEIILDLNEPEEPVENANNVSIQDTTVFVSQSVQFSISKCFQVSGLTGFGCEILGKAYIINGSSGEIDANNEPVSFVLWWDPESSESNTTFQSRKNIQNLVLTGRKISLELLFRLKHFSPQESADDDGGVEAGKAYATFSFDMKSGEQHNIDKCSVVLVENIIIQWEEEVLPFLQQSQTLPLQISVEEERSTFARVVIKRTPSPGKKRVINHSQITTTARVLPATTILCITIKDVENFNQFLAVAKSKSVKSVCFEFDICLGSELHENERSHPGIRFDTVHQLWFRTFRSTHFDVDVMRHGSFKFINHAHMIVHPDWITYLQRKLLTIRVLTSRFSDGGPNDDVLVEIGHASIPLADVLLHVQGVNDRFPLEVLQTNGGIVSAGKVGVHVYIDHEAEKVEETHDQRFNVDLEVNNKRQVPRLKDEREDNVSGDENDISYIHEDDSDSGNAIVGRSKSIPRRRQTGFHPPTSDNDDHDLHHVDFEQGDYSDNENKGKSSLQRRPTELFPTSEDIRKLLDEGISDDDSEHHVHFAEDHQTDVPREKEGPFRRRPTRLFPTASDMKDHLDNDHHVHFPNGEVDDDDDRKPSICGRLTGLPSLNERNKFENVGNSDDNAGYHVHFPEDALLGGEKKSLLRRRPTDLFPSVDDMRKMLEGVSNNESYPPLVTNAGSRVDLKPPKKSEFLESDEPLPESSELNTSFSVEGPVLQVLIHEARNLTLDADSSNDYHDDTVVAPSTWISFLWQDGLATMETPMIKKSYCPKFDYSCIVAMAEPSLKCLRDQTMTFNVWQEPNLNSSVRSLSFGKLLVGRVCVDLTLLSNGWKSIEGWYHVVDEKHRNRGQVKISVTPITGTENVSTESESSFEEVAMIDNAEKEEENEFEVEQENNKIQLIQTSVLNELHSPSEGTVVNAVRSPDTFMSLSSAVESIAQVAVEIQQKFGDFNQNKVDEVVTQHIENTTCSPDDIDVERALTELSCDQSEDEEIEEDVKNLIDEVKTDEEDPINSLAPSGDAFHKLPNVSNETFSEYFNTEKDQEQVAVVIPTMSDDSSGCDETITINSLHSLKALDPLSTDVVAREDVTSDFLDQSGSSGEIERKTENDQEQELPSDSEELMPAHAIDNYELKSDEEEKDTMNDEAKEFPSVANEVISANSSESYDAEADEEETEAMADPTKIATSGSNQIIAAKSNNDFESESDEEKHAAQSDVIDNENTISNILEENINVAEVKQLGDESEVAENEVTTTPKEVVLTSEKLYEDSAVNSHLIDEATDEKVFNEEPRNESEVEETLQQIDSVDEIIEENTIIPSREENALTEVSGNELIKSEVVFVDVAVQASFPEVVEEVLEPAVPVDTITTSVEVQTTEQVEATCPVQSPAETPMVASLHSSFASSVDKFDLAYQLLTELREKCPELGKRNEPSKESTPPDVRNDLSPVKASSVLNMETIDEQFNNQVSSMSNFLYASSISENLTSTYNVPSPVNTNETTTRSRGSEFSLSGLSSSRIDQVHNVFLNPTPLRTPFDSETERIAKIMKGTLDFWMDDDEEEGEASCKEEEEETKEDFSHNKIEFEAEQETKAISREEKEEEEDDDDDDYFF